MRYIAPVKLKSNTDGWAFSVWLITIVPVTFFRGWVLSVVWNWFIPKIFHGMPVLTIGQALGLSLVIMLFTASLPTISKELDGKSFGYKLYNIMTSSLLKGAMVLFIGFIYHFFV
jgi:hypothetical protein